MSAPEHERAAMAAEAEAAQVSGSLPQSPRELACANAPCATAAVRQTEDSRHLLDLATKHRAAASELRDAEQSACVGIPGDVRDVSPLAAPVAILVTSPYEERQGRYGKRLRGAVLEISAAPGLTAEKLRRAIVCHMAHVAGTPSRDPLCPLAVGGASSEVELKGARLTVRIAAGDRKAAEEIWRRARTLFGER